MVNYFCVATKNQNKYIVQNVYLLKYFLCNVRDWTLMCIYKYIHIGILFWQKNSFTDKLNVIVELIGSVAPHPESKIIALCKYTW